ncbi:hypothetical protein GCM10010191_56070 [Actinomadura vinacea]|uniref:Histidine kinase/HSP90-like ATPase domain-containing protein n=1 Tax=Actinomadura vinacea TaxID=115336 RepID=A0ABN3JM15_9ACTN
MNAETVAQEGLDMTFVAAATAPAQVRTHLKFRLSDWGLLRAAEDVCVIAGELITNAVESTPDREIRVRFTRERCGVVLAVWGSSDDLPVSRPLAELSLTDITPDPEALDPGHDDGTGGWGLPIIEALSAQCGVRKTHPHGKWVWSLVSF